MTDKERIKELEAELESIRSRIIEESWYGGNGASYLIYVYKPKDGEDTRRYTEARTRRIAMREVYHELRRLGNVDDCNEERWQSLLKDLM